MEVKSAFAMTIHIERKPVNTAFHELSNIFILAKSPPPPRLRRARVEVRRIELLSKHILRKLSTCLFANWLSEKDRVATNQSFP
jgi:hypothetical protein